MESFHCKLVIFVVVIILHRAIPMKSNHLKHPLHRHHHGHHQAHHRNHHHHHVPFQNTNEMEQYVIGGEPARLEDFPYIVSLQTIHVNEGRIHFEHYCAGTLIAPNFVLTAAHCLDNKNIKDIAVFPAYSRPVHRKFHLISKAFIHDGYTLGQFHDDIALLQLRYKLRLKKLGLVPPRLADRSYKDLEHLTLTGWGLKHEEGLMKSTLPWLTNGQCRQFFGSRYVPGMICAGGSGKSSCFGDSGGPLIAKGPTPGEDVLIGIVSWGLEKCAQTPGVFTDVLHYITWIRSKGKLIQTEQEKPEAIPLPPIPVTDSNASNDMSQDYYHEWWGPRDEEIKK